MSLGGTILAPPPLIKSGMVLVAALFGDTKEGESNVLARGKV